MQQAKASKEGNIQNDRQISKKQGSQAVDSSRERAILVGVDMPRSEIQIEASLDELEQLALSAGAEVLGRVTQKLDEPHSRHYLGKGKLDELARVCEETGANVAIFDDELKPRVQQELESHLDLKVIDRTALILDIFSRRARTHEGRVQVELAQYQYLLPRLVGRGTALSRLGGGIGTRGPGETKLESDRRRIRQHITKLEKDIEQIRMHRRVHRSSRQSLELPLVAIVGYTNVGKSTLLNRLTGSDVEAADKLFATLDPTTRRLELPSGQEALVSDTVGFISKLPTALVAAFRATLEELEDADLLLEVVDITDPQAEQASQVVEDILADLGLQDKPMITVLNKADLLVTEDPRDGADPLEGMTPQSLGLEPVPNTVLVSATTGWGLEALKASIEDALNTASARVVVRVPFESSDLVDLFRRKGAVQLEEHTDSGTVMRGRLPARYLAQFEPYLMPGEEPGGGKKRSSQRQGA